MWNQNAQQDAPTQGANKPVMSSGPAQAESESAGMRKPLINGASMAETAMIGKSLVIKGELTGSESIYIDGTVEGTINLPGHRVTIGRNGRVTADIHAREIVVHGTIVGNADASERIDVHSDGSLTGDAVAQRISMEDGAYFKGKVDIRRANSPGEKIRPASEKGPDSLTDQTRVV